MEYLRKIIARFRQSEQPKPVAPKVRGGLRAAIAKARIPLERAAKTNSLVIRAANVMQGVLPKGAQSAIAMDSNLLNFPALQIPGFYGSSLGFPGFPYLAALTTRAEFRQLATSFSTEMTREWLKLQGSETASDETKEKITEITTALDEMDLRGIIRTLIEHDCFYGRAQLFINIRGHKADTPLVVSQKTIKKGDKFTVRPIGQRRSATTLQTLLKTTSISRPRGSCLVARLTRRACVRSLRGPSRICSSLRSTSPG